MVTYLKRKLCSIENEYNFEIGKIFVMRACEIKRVKADLYGSPCTHWIAILININCYVACDNHIQKDSVKPNIGIQWL